MEDGVKNEINAEANEEEFIDVGGDPDSEIRHVPSGSHIIRQPRYRRARRQAEASPYGQYTAGRIIARNTHQIGVEMEEDQPYEEIIDDAPEEAAQIAYNNPDGLENEIERDIALVSRTRSHRLVKEGEYADFGPVQFRFDSTQRKKQVIVYNSVKYPDHASEWYFARKNNSTQNETYRCVQCRRYREEAKKGNRTDVENLPEARIIVQNERFLTDPDEPLGKHICDFETNERTLIHHVWARRALSKANSELRVRPEKPKEKFNKLLHEIRYGREYAHLSPDVRQLIYTELTKGKGFSSKRRSFARNNRYGYEHGVRVNAGIETDAYGQIMYYLCGMDQCKERFNTPEERTIHRETYHSNVLFIDTKEQLEEYNNYRRLNGGLVSGEELVVANEQVVLEDQLKSEGPEQYEVIVTDPDQEAFYSQTCYLLESIRESAIGVLEDPERREKLFNMLSKCDIACKQLMQFGDADGKSAPTTDGPSDAADNGGDQDEEPRSSKQ